MNSVHYLLFMPFHIGSAEIEKAAKVRAAMEAKAKREAARSASAQSESKEGE